MPEVENNMPGVEETPNIEESAPSQEPSPEPEEEVKDESQEAPERPKPDRVQRRIDKLTRKYREEQRRNQELAERLARLEEELEQLRNPPPKKPSREDFDTTEEYLAALLEYQTSLPEQKSTKTSSKQTSDTYTPPPEWEEQVEEAKERYSDFEQVALDPMLPVTKEMAEVIVDSERGADVLYYLGKNRSEAARIASLSPTAQARELGKIEARLDELMPSRPKKSVTKAPEPIPPVGGDDVPTKDPARMTMEEFMRWRDKQEGLG